MNPGPGTYENNLTQFGGVTGDGKSNEVGTTSFMAVERPHFVAQSLKNNYPGPGDYQVPKDTANQQMGLASHFAMAVGRDFSNIEKLKLLVEKNIASTSTPLTKALNGDIQLTDSTNQFIKIG